MYLFFLKNQKIFIDNIKNGIQEGLREGIRINIIDVLEDKFQLVDGVEELLNGINKVFLLRKDFDFALKTDSLASFIRMLSKLKK